MTTSDDWTTIGKAQYVVLTTFRKNGTPVGTPVWIAPEGNSLIGITEADAWKVKRIRNNPTVQLQPCDLHGKIVADSPIVSGSARVMEPDDTRRVRSILGRKYGLIARLGMIKDLVKGKGSALGIEILPVGR